MNYKKLVSLLAVSTLALSACGTTDDAEETATEETEEVAETEEAATEETETAEEGASEGATTEDLLQQAQEQSGEAFPEYGLYVAGGWTQDGIVIQHAPGEAATIPVQITTDHEEYYVYLVEDGVITDVATNEPEPEFTVDAPSADTEYVVGISGEDMGEIGDEVNTEDFYRSEIVIFEEAEPAAEGEE